ncbi:transglycosylase domain-containing protein [Amphibacillus jilinensis]|uniref:transglycosylase domain-containing protein n=1 Tax=Amphibacillus jilinensis TaxID=1216008 RepID=UPI0002D63CE4|nr:transglycosylase domain-containing protein [Amphibacillus jilinensis]
MHKRLGLWISWGLIIGFITMLTTMFLLGKPELNDQPIMIYDNEGELLGSVYPDGERLWSVLDQINPKLIEATLMIEDQNFYQHSGFDLKRIGGALLENIRQQNLAEGASTITQQYARNLYLSHEKTWLRKLAEAVYTFRLEQHYDKDTLLEGYLNTIYYGHGIYGVETASQFYFGKSTKQLSTAEIAMLVAIPNRPNAYSPLDHFDRAKQQQLNVLQTLKRTAVIDETAYDLATREQLEVIAKPLHDLQFGYVADLAIAEASQILEKDQFGGYHIYTTINSSNQDALSQAVQQHIEDLQVGALMADPATGAIEAMVGGVDYYQSTYNRAVQAKRMVGSTFKPILYYTALEHGFTAATTLKSEPTTFLFNDRDSYSPSNFNHAYADDTVTLAQALAVSDNIYAIKTQLFLTPELVIDRGRLLGISSPLDPVPALALGTASLSVEEIVAAYSHFANGGHQVDPYLVDHIVNDQGENVYHRDHRLGEQVLDEQVTFILNQLLTGMFDPNLSSYLSVTGGSISEDLSGNYAGKSGTTGTDSWMVGYSPELVVGVWTGYDDNRKLSNTHAAKRIWRDAIESGHDQKSRDSFIAPPGIVAAYIDPTTGLLSSEHCPVSRLMFFIEGTEPKQHCQADH